MRHARRLLQERVRRPKAMPAQMSGSIAFRQARTAGPGAAAARPVGLARDRRPDRGQCSSKACWISEPTTCAPGPSSSLWRIEAAPPADRQARETWLATIRRRWSGSTLPPALQRLPRLQTLGHPGRLARPRRGRRRPQPAADVLVRRRAAGRGEDPAGALELAAPGEDSTAAVLHGAPHRHGGHA